MNPPIITQIEMARQYCERQEQEPMQLLQIMEDQEARWDNDGFMLMECVALDSSECGSLWILPYGPRNTFKEIPTHPISRNGMASNMSTVKAIAWSKREADRQAKHITWMEGIFPQNTPQTQTPNG